jgi:hypothetical protein
MQIQQQELLSQHLCNRHLLDALPWPGIVCEHGHVQYACERHSNGNLPGTVYGSLFVAAVHCPSAAAVMRHIILG